MTRFMTVRPAKFFSFSARHADLLTDLFPFEKGISEADLFEKLERNSGEDGPEPEHLFQQLRQHHCLELAPGTDALWQLTFPVRQLLAFLLRKQLLTGAAIIRAYVAKMEQACADLEHAARERDAEALIRALEELQPTLERLRNDSSNNRERLTTEAIELKSDTEQAGTRARFTRINHLWNRYLIPLRDILDTDGAMDACLDRLRQAISNARIVFVTQGSLDSALIQTQRILTHLRRSVFADHEECVREIQPLYQQLRRETRLVRGAARALERLRSEGWQNLPVETWLALPRRTHGPRFTDIALEGYLHGLRNYTPTRPAPLRDSHDDPPVVLIEPAALQDLLDRQVPLQDVLAWLIDRYPTAAPADILRAYGWIIAGEFGHAPAPSERPVQEYAVADIELRAKPLTLRQKS